MSESVLAFNLTDVDGREPVDALSENLQGLAVAIAGLVADPFQREAALYALAAFRGLEVEGDSIPAQIPLFDTVLGTLVDLIQAIDDAIAEVERSDD